MTTYRRKKDSDTWHWCTKCRHWPKDYEEYEEREFAERPSSNELCDECLAKEDRGECKEY